MARLLDLSLTVGERVAQAERDLVEFVPGRRVEVDMYWWPRAQRFARVVATEVRKEVISERLTLVAPMVRVHTTKPLCLTQRAWAMLAGSSQSMLQAVEMQGKREHWIHAALLLPADLGRRRCAKT